jgi:hypothetical protein
MYGDIVGVLQNISSGEGSFHYHRTEVLSDMQMINL